MILRIWAQDPPYDIQGEFWNVQIKKAILPELGVGFMPKPLQKPHPPIHISIASPDCASAKLAGAKGWGIISGPVAPLYAVATIGRPIAKPPPGGQARTERRLAGVAPCHRGADRRRGRGARLRRAGLEPLLLHLYADRDATAKRLYMIKPRPDMTDEECTPEAIMQECVIHGSPRTVLDKLVALRERVGPFGTLLQIGLDWGGPNEAWERDGMRLLAQEVMPKFRQHVTAQAAE